MNEMNNILFIDNPPIHATTYIIMNDQNASCVLIDPFDFTAIDVIIVKNKLEPEWIFLTHEHYDHVGAVNELVKKYGCKILTSVVCGEMLKDSRKNLSVFFHQLMELHGLRDYPQVNYTIGYVDDTFMDNYSMLWNSIRFYFKQTPGHSPGSICIMMDDAAVFTGDSLLENEPPKLSGPGGSKKGFKEITVPFLTSLPEDIWVFPGHGFPYRQKGKIDEQCIYKKETDD